MKSAFPMILACYERQTNDYKVGDGPLQLIGSRKRCGFCGGNSLFESSPCVLCQLNRDKQVLCLSTDFVYLDGFTGYTQEYTR